MAEHSPYQPGSRLSPEIRALIRAEYRAGGATLEEIARRHGSNRETVRHLVADLSEQRRRQHERERLAKAASATPKKRRLTPQDIAEIRRLRIEERMSRAEVAQRFGVTLQTVTNLLRGTAVPRLLHQGQHGSRPAAKAYAFAARIRAPRLRLADRQRIVVAYRRGGTTHAALAAQYGLSVSGVRAIVQAGLPDDAGRVLIPLTDAHLAALATAPADATAASLARQVNAPYATVAKALARMRRDGGWLCRLALTPCTECGLPVAGPPRATVHEACRAARVARYSRERRANGAYTSTPDVARWRATHQSEDRALRDREKARRRDQYAELPGQEQARIVERVRGADRQSQPLTATLAENSGERWTDDDLARLAVLALR